MKTLSVIIVAAGMGRRMGSDVPKQFLVVRGRPILMHSIAAFAEAMERIVVLPEEYLECWAELCREYKFDIPHRVVSGWRERYDSVRRGLAAVSEDAQYVAVHDGVRPWVSGDVISRTLEVARKDGGAIPIVRVTDTIRFVDDLGKTVVLDRNRLLAVQTPQIFRRDILMRSYAVLENGENITDDASVVERAGYAIGLADGDAANIKITYVSDLG